MHRVAVLALDNVSPFELSIPNRVLGSAYTAALRPLYDVVTCSVDGGAVRTHADFGIAVEHGAEALATADTVVIPTAHGHPGVHERGVLPAVLERALAHVRPGTRMVSICIGSFVLASAGLLDGRRATTHWRYSAAFQRLFPRVRVDADVLFVDDGDVLTSAGATAGVDLCMHIVRRDHGSEVANRAARVCVVPPWREGGQTQYIEQPVPEPAAASTASARAWALEHLHRPVRTVELAARAGMSLRTFTRRFREEVGSSPAQWLGWQRVEVARRLLETSDLPVDRVAERAGFGTAVSLRQRFRRATGVSPVSYRRAFRFAEPEDGAPTGERGAAIGP